jgi:type IV pilus assembly protein PilF
MMRVVAWILMIGTLLVACAGPLPNRAATRERAEIRLALAQAYFEQGQLAVALEEADRSLAIDATHAQAHVLRGLVLMSQQQPERARASLDQALALDARLVSAWHNRAWLLCQQGQWSAADSDFSQALVWANGPARVQTLMTQGVCLSKAQSWEQAEQRLSQALDLDSRHPMALYHWARVQQARGRWPEAQQALQHLNASPHVSAESLRLGILGAQQLGDTQAEAQWSQALQHRFTPSKPSGDDPRKPVHDR